MSKKLVEPEGPQMTSRMTHMRSMMEKQGYMHAGAPTHTHTETCNAFCFSTATMVPGKRLMLRYTYIELRTLSACPSIPSQGT